MKATVAPYLWQSSCHARRAPMVPCFKSIPEREKEKGTYRQPPPQAASTAGAASLCQNSCRGPRGPAGAWACRISEALKQILEAPDELSPLTEGRLRLGRTNGAAQKGSWWRRAGGQAQTAQVPEPCSLPSLDLAATHGVVPEPPLPPPVPGPPRTRALGPRMVLDADEVLAGIYRVVPSL